MPDFSRRRIDNLNRKIIHALSSVVICFFPYFFTLRQIILICLLFSLIFLLSKYFNFLPIIKVKRNSFGEVVYPLGIMISSLLFLRYGHQGILSFQFGVLVLGMSDAMANIIGDLYGRHKFNFRWGKKSIEGFLAFFITTILILILFTSFQVNLLLYYLGIALVLSFLEFFLFLGLDNLVIPTVAAFLFFYFI